MMQLALYSVAFLLLLLAWLEYRIFSMFFIDGDRYQILEALREDYRFRTTNF